MRVRFWGTRGSIPVALTVADIRDKLAQALNDVGNELAAQRQDMATLQDEIDSLRQAMAHQDTIIKRLINVTGIPPSP